MNREDKYLSSLMQELPREKAPKGITELIMQKIVAREIAIEPIRQLKVWQTQAFYIMIAVVCAEAWLLWSSRYWLTLAHLETLLKSAYIQIYQYFAVNNFNSLATGIVLAGVLLYLFVRERIENTRYCVGILQ